MDKRSLARRVSRNLTDIVVLWTLTTFATSNSIETLCAPITIAKTTFQGTVWAIFDPAFVDIYARLRAWVLCEPGTPLSYIRLAVGSECKLPGLALRTHVQEQGCGQHGEAHDAHRLSCRQYSRLPTQQDVDAPLLAVDGNCFQWRGLEAHGAYVRTGVIR